MPIFMDRHDLFETMTAETVAQIHQEDLKIQEKFGCRGLTYWFDDIRKTAFCLVEAPDMEAIVRMHSNAHGDVPTSIIEVEPSIVESFLGRIEDPVKARNTKLNIINDPAFRTILVMEWSCSPTRRMDSMNTFKSALEELRMAVLDLLKLHDGTPVRQSDNDLLVSFKSVTSAVHACKEVQSLFRKKNRQVLNGRFRLKIGVSAGVPVTEKKHIFEDTIKMAERMCRAVDGQIIISTEVKELYNSENIKRLKDENGLRCLTPSDETFLQDFAEYMECNWNNANLQIEVLAKSMGLSRSQLYRKTTMLTGKSPNSFLREYRLHEALKLLGKRRNNISQIAFETGFTSQSYFSKCFQKKYGYSPSDHAPLS